MLPHARHVEGVLASGKRMSRRTVALVVLMDESTDAIISRQLDGVFCAAPSARSTQR